MNDKMIEEMYNLFLNYKYGKVDWKKFDCIKKDFFEFLYNAGYRKIPEGSVVLSKEEFDEDYVTKQDRDYWENKTEILENKLKQARKETAEKILKELYHREELGFETIKWYAKEYWGIEIKE